MSKLPIIAAAAAALLPAVAQAQQLQYPTTRQDASVVDDYFGTKVHDPYRWLENDTSAETALWVQQQNKVTQQYLSTIPYRDKLLRRLTSLANYERSGAPSEHNGKYYYFSNNGLQNQSVLYETSAPGTPGRVFLDPNKLSADGTVALSGVYFSGNGKYVAYMIARSGSDWQEIYLLDAQGNPLPDHVEWVKVTNLAWAGDGFFYSSYDRPTAGKELSNVNENHKVFYHRVGTSQDDDELVYQDPEHPLRFNIVSGVESEDYLFLEQDGEAAGNSLYVMNLKQRHGTFVPMTTDMNYQHQPIEVVNGTLYLFTNYNAPLGRVMAVDLKNPGRDNWREVIPQGKNTIASADIIGGKLLVEYMQDACSHAFVYNLDGTLVREVQLPGPGSVAFSGELDDDLCYYSYTSFETPSAIYSYNIATGESKPYWSPKVQFNTADYVTEQIFFTSKDGTRVPMFATHKKGIKLNGKNPVLLYGYGGFNISLNPGFSYKRVPFLEAGGVYVTVNLRGGGEYGEEWHQAGTKMNKQNVFDDFIGAAEWLVANKWTNPSKIAIMGGSNGGLLVGACMAQRPDLYQCVIAQVGVMDMLRYHLFTIGWNWAPDYGTSADSKQMFEYLYRYSPLHALRDGTKYPATMVTTADHDDRVVPAHSFKFAARLQQAQAGDAPTIIRIDSKAGHGGGKPISKQLEEAADEYAFIMKQLGMKMK